MLGARVHLEFSVHRVPHLCFRQHAANRFFDEPNRLALADVNRALFAQAAFEAAMPAIQLLCFLLPGQLD